MKTCLSYTLQIKAFINTFWWTLYRELAHKNNTNWCFVAVLNFVSPCVVNSVLKIVYYQWNTIHLVLQMINVTCISVGQGLGTACDTFFSQVSWNYAWWRHDCSCRRHDMPWPSTGPVCVETTARWWFPLLRANNVDLWCFRYCKFDQAVEHTVELSMVRNAIALMWHRCIVYCRLLSSTVVLSYDSWVQCSPVLALISRQTHDVIPPLHWGCDLCASLVRPQNWPGRRWRQKGG